MTAAFGLGLLVIVAFLISRKKANSWKQRASGVLIWTLLWVVIMFLLIGISLLGDCPEYINANWPDTACSDRKEIARPIILYGGPIVWLGMTIFLLRRWSR